MSETIFSKIIRGEIPCFKIYEDTHVLAFLDVGVAVRDSKNRSGPALMFTEAEWSAFVNSAKDGEFDIAS